MRSLPFRQALEGIRQQLNSLSRSTEDGNILIGVAGCVATGKSRFCSILRSDAEVLLRRSVFYLPFDLWINSTSLGVRSYAGRFFLDDLEEAIRCMRSGERFLVPRYDIIKTAGIQKAESQLTIQQVLWNGKSFTKCSRTFGDKLLLGSTDMYVERESGYLYSLFSPTTNSIFLIDGTMIFPKSVVALYHLRIFVHAPWPMRIARMIRRFNRREVFGSTIRTMEEYVGFLVEEARLCADEEVGRQIDDSMFLVESTPDTLSNYLDLCYLHWLIRQPNSPNWAKVEEVEETLKAFLLNLQTEHDSQTLALRRQELIALMESKHLLSLEGIEKILAELASTLL